MIIRYLRYSSCLTMIIKSLVKSIMLWYSENILQLLFAYRYLILKIIITFNFLQFRHPRLVKIVKTLVNILTFVKHFIITLWLDVLDHKNNCYSFCKVFFLQLKHPRNDYKKFGECHNSAVFRKYFTITLCIQVPKHQNDHSFFNYLFDVKTPLPRILL